MAYVKGPDFPTGGIIYGYQGIKDAFETGRGRIVMRARTEIENTASGREVIVVKEVPYQVNKAEMIKKIAELINDKKIEGISYINDETDRKGVRIVIICKKEAQASVVLNNLYKHTQLQTTFNVNNIALVHGRPKLLSLKNIIKYFVEHRHEVVIRRTKFDLEESEKKAHILEGLLIALDNLDAVISLIRGSKTPDEAKEGLMTSFGLSEAQAKAILEMRLQRLTGLEREKIKLDYEELQKLIAWLRNLLADESLRMQVIKDELNSMIEQYGDERLTTIIPDEGEFNPEDFYSDDDMIITVSHLGYIKRTPLSEFKTQARGGKGSKGSETRDEDYLEHMYHATMHNTMLFFTENGRCFWQKVYEIPEGTKTSKGRAIQNLLNVDPNDKVKAFINLKSLVDQEYISNNYIVLCTKHGVIKKTSLEAYSRPRQNGINAINIREGDSLLEAQLTNGNNEILIAVRSGKAIRFNEKTVRPMGRTASGVTGIRFAEKNDIVIGMICIDDPSKSVLVVSEKGYGKRTELDDYRITNRGGRGVKTINITDKTGHLIAIKSVTDKDDIMIINKSGIAIRLAVSNLRLMGRATQGVRLINIKAGDSIAAVTDVVGSAEESEEKDNSNEGEDNLTA
jgi:DNA gyrase subunit A